MIGVAEVVLLLIALYALVRGKFPISSGHKYVVRGWRARVIGGIGLLPVPLSLAVSTAVAAVFVAQGKQVTPQSFFWVGTVIEASCLGATILIMVLLTCLLRTPLEAGQIPDSNHRFQAPWPTLLEAIDGALRDMRVKAVKWSDDRHRVSGRLGASFWSWGEWLMVEADESGEVRVKSKCGQLIDWGTNAENRRTFMRILAGRLESGAGVAKKVPTRFVWGKASPLRTSAGGRPTHSGAARRFIPDDAPAGGRDVGYLGNSVGLHSSAPRQIGDWRVAMRRGESADWLVRPTLLLTDFFLGYLRRRMGPRRARRLAAVALARRKPVQSLGSIA